MKQKINFIVLSVFCCSVFFSACKIPAVVSKTESKNVPPSFKTSTDTTNSAQLSWQQYFNDDNLSALIDTALANNQELNITLQEIVIARNEVRARKGEYLPFVGIRGAAGVDKVGQYTRDGAVEENLNITPKREFPEFLPDFRGGLFASWELDVWRKLRNARDAAFKRYAASVDGKNFMITNLVAEIADAYYELLAYDNQLLTLRKNIEIQSSALEIVKLQKQAARVTELAVRRFEAEVLHTKSMEFDIRQKIVETENHINLLVGRFPQRVVRLSNEFDKIVPQPLYAGVPAQLLENRADIKKAEQNLEAAKLDIKVAKANFYPSIGLSGGIGLQAFDPTKLIKMPQSILFSLVGDLAAPLVNKNAIKATYYTANAKQLQAVYDYERTVLNAYVEVANQLAKIDNLEKSYDLKSKQVAALNQSIEISTMLFKMARADYMEVLLTQRDALDSKFELIETKMEQLDARVNVYRALGGGWR